MENRNKVIIIILSILLVVTGVAAVYFGVTSANSKVQLESQISELENKMNSCFEVEEIVEENEVNDNTEVTENNVQNSVEISTYKIVDVSKNLNQDMYLSKQYDNVKTKIIDGKAYVAFTINNIGSASYNKELNKYYEISGVNGKVVDISIDTIPTSGYPIFVMLMEDGTLQKTKFVQGSDIVCEGKISGYENIVRIDDVEIVNTNKFGDSVSTQYSKGIVVTDKDGNTELLKDLY